MRKWLVQTIILSSLVGVYIMYARPIIDNLVLMLNWERPMDSSYLFAAGAVVIIVVGSLLGKMLTRGMN